MAYGGCGLPSRDRHLHLFSFWKGHLMDCILASVCSIFSLLFVLLVDYILPCIFWEGRRIWELSYGGFCTFCV